MPLSAKLDRIQQLAIHGGESNGTPPGIARTYVAEALRQLRAPFVSHFSPEDAAALLGRALDLALHYRGPAPRIEHEVTGNTVRLWTLMPDQPFIVDTIRLMLRARGWEYSAGFNLVLGVRRGADGRVEALGAEAGPVESLTFSEAQVEDAGQVAAAVADLQVSLRLVQAMVADFDATAAFVEGVADRLMQLSLLHPDSTADVRETAEFLRWIVADNFVLMSCVMGDRRLGVARPEMAPLWSLDSLLSWGARSTGPIVRVRKGESESRVHRAGRVDEIRVELPGEDGGPPQVLYLQGLFTYRAVSQPARNVPWLRRTLATILAAQDSQPGSYRYKGIGNAFDSLPTEFLFTASEAEVAEIIERILEAEQQQDARAQLIQRPDEHFTFALVAMPKARWTEQLRQKMGALVISATGATYSDQGVFVGRFDTALVHYFLTGARTLEAAELEQLSDALTDLATPWEDLLYQHISELQGTARANEVLARYGDAFDAEYKRISTPERALLDIALIEGLQPDRALAADLFVNESGGLNLRIFQARDVLLSEMLPVLDNFGLIVIDQYSNNVRLDGLQVVNIDTFRLKGVWGLRDEQVLEQSAALISAIEAVFARNMDDDMLNRVLLRAELPWQGVDLLRACLGYVRQLGRQYTLVRFQELMLAQPELLHQWWELFQTRFDPDRKGNREQAYSALSESFLDQLRAVDDHDQDLVFRTLHNLVDSMLRTNLYRTDRAEWYISFKLDCAKVWNMPEPRMKYEVYVHHPQVEGVHLRGGPIARGGIRWSDRSDFRREILDLVSTQMVKNVLIVPEGAKGGFFLKKGVADRDERRKRADDMYEFLIRGLLDVTDNIIDGGIVHPPRVVRHDGDDPYLVVAADKGTAHLSDRANRISRSYGFWLDDAFASGGSQGYDHKVVGITARGGWRLAARHFREMGKDPYTQAFTCVGIGDTAGDVFGNGVIETPHMRLLAAFNHSHIFLDPNPDAARCFQERVRLFQAAKGWEDYDQSLISDGGGIFSRRAKSIPLSPEVQKMLGTLKTELPVDAVIRLILRMDVDLLWNGGIGTYVKASTESHAQAKDPANDELRINADELRCKIVGEGGNLGFTQEGRIEYALAGGRINNDAVDNSGGVDMSDHEVNLKILYSRPLGRGEMTVDQRNSELESLTNTVAQQVLANSDTHGRQLSLDQIRSARDPLYFWPTIQWVCTRGGRTTAELHLPNLEVLRRRASSRQGLTRPELAVLQAHVKMHVFKDLMNEDPSLIPGFEALVLNYFPAEIRERMARDIQDHMLHRHIGMTVVLSQVCGRAGATYFPSLMELTGASPARIAAAWFHAMALIDKSSLAAELKASTSDPQARYQGWIALTDAALRLVTTWLAPGEPDITPAQLEDIRNVLQRLPRTRGSSHNERLRNRMASYMAAGLPEDLAQRLSALGELTVAREIALLQEDPEHSSSMIVRYLAIGEASRLLPAIRALELRQTRDRWDPVAMSILRNRYISLIRELVKVVAVDHEVKLGVDRLALRLAREGTGELAQLQDEMNRILGDDPDLPTLLVAEERVRAWIARFRTRQPTA